MRHRIFVPFPLSFVIILIERRSLFPSTIRDVSCFASFFFQPWIRSYEKQGKQSFEIPLILDEPYDLVETAALHYGSDSDCGLLAGADLPAALLSMSGYGKPHLDEAEDFDTTKQYSEQSYVFPEQPQTRSQYNLTAVPGSSQASSVQALSYDSYQPRETFDEPSSFVLGPAKRAFPVIESWSPTKGPRGTRICVTIQSVDDLEGPPTYSFPLIFGAKRQLSEMTRVAHQDQYYRYTLAADVPAFVTTGYTTPAVKLAMQMIDDTGRILGRTDVGDYFYTDASSGRVEDYQQKRKQPVDTIIESSRGPVKRVVSQQIRPKPEEEFSVMTYGPSPRNISAYASAPASSYLQASPRMEESPRIRQSSFHQAPSYTGAVQPQTVKARSPITPSPAWTPGFSQVGARISQSPSMTITNAKVRGSQTSGDPMPTLFRTSTLAQGQSFGGSAPAPQNMGQSGPQFNPYALFQSKAVLKIEGDLESMTESNWTAPEWEAKRRIVRFRRSQNGSTISTTFEPVSIDERPPNSICISCIWWEGKKECYVTSVDTIYLLESLVAVRFTVEEKNRIRRNLEGFRPLTVSKAKSDSEDFFKVIMGFPNPKPRNIEKDVKSASYSSTAGAILPTGPSGYGSMSSVGVNTIDTFGVQRPSPSPRSASASVTSITRTPSLTTSLAYSPNTGQSGQGHQQFGVVTPDLRANSYGAVWPPAPIQHQQQVQQQIQEHQQPQQYSDAAAAAFPLAAPSGRSSWDLSGYIEPSVVSTAGGPSMYYTSLGFSTTGEEMQSIQRRMSHHTTRP